MTAICKKVLELTAIENHNEKTYLSISLSFDEGASLFWEIDRDTAENLQTIAQFDGQHRYRLSFSTTFVAAGNQPYLGTLTKTYRDKSCRIEFACSARFKSQLDLIRSMQGIDEAEKLPFLTRDLPFGQTAAYTHQPAPAAHHPVPPVHQPALAADGENGTVFANSQTVNGQKGAASSRRYRLPLKWTSTAVISILFFMLLVGSSNYPHEDVREQPHISIAEAEIAHAHAGTEAATVPPAAAAPVAEEAEEDSAILLELPSFELEEPVTFSLPEGYVALTFDDGPSRYTAEIVDLLRKYQVGGTFFFTGYNAKKYPDYVQYVRENGYSLGSHTMNHVNMATLSADKQENEIRQFENVIQELTREEVLLFRPPYEAFNDDTKEIIRNKGYKMVLWNRDSEDWKTRNAEKIYQYVQSIEASGSIILLHESKAVVDALPNIIEHLQAQGLQIVSLK